MIRSFFSDMDYTGLGFVCQAKSKPHDVVWANTWLKRWIEIRKCKDVMTVNRGMDLAGRAENGGNLGSGIPQTNLIFSRISWGRPRNTPDRHKATYRTQGAGSSRDQEIGSSSITFLIISTTSDLNLIWKA
jgi:hypothetical protein